MTVVIVTPAKVTLPDRCAYTAETNKCWEEEDHIILMPASRTAVLKGMHTGSDDDSWKEEQEEGKEEGGSAKHHCVFRR